MKITPEISYKSLAYDTIKKLSVSWLNLHFSFEWHVTNWRKKFFERDQQNRNFVEQKLNEAECLLNKALKTE